MTAAPHGSARYRIRFQTVSFHGAADLRIRALRDRQQYDDPDGAAEAAGISPASWPLFGQVWPSARMLAGALAGRDLHGMRILEVGCGLALVSLVAHRNRADVTASDCHPLAAAFLHANLRLNGLPPMRYATGDWARRDAGLGRFDLIVGSDVLYERQQPEQLSAFIERHAAPGAEVAIVDPGRGQRAAFSRQMAGHGFAHSEARLDGPQASGEAYRGRMLSYTRS